ncbi:oligosaccharide flippase family protein [Hyphobacterium sp. CCMP332]|nr:oligosaccharide flippase family protein [Hyphobacterium sp. CCMP332]
MKILKSSIWSVASVGIRSVIIFIVNKLFAANYGPQGITLLAHFQNLLSIFLTVPNDGVNKGVIKYAADSTLDEKNYYPILNAGLVLNLSIFLICVIGIFLLKGNFENPFTGTNTLWLILVFFLALLQLINLLGLSILLAKEKLQPFVILQVVGNVISLLMVWVLIEMASFQEALLGWASGPAISLVFTFIYLLRKEKLSIFKLFILPSLAYLRKLSDFILMALSIVIFSKSVDFIIRQYAISNFNTIDTGHWQSVVRISDLYLMAFVAVLSMVYYPRVSSIINKEDELKAFVKAFFWKASALSIPFLIIVYLFRSEFLILFFNKGFTDAAWLFPYQLLGDFFKMASWILAFLILAQSRTRLFVSSQFVFAIILLSVTYYLIGIFGIEGFPMAYAFKQALYLIFVIYVYRKMIS